MDLSGFKETCFNRVYFTFLLLSQDQLNWIRLPTHSVAIILRWSDLKEELLCWTLMVFRFNVGDMK